MARGLEDIFSQWATPPSRTEEQRCENAIKAIRNAIDRSSKLKIRNLKVFPQGSYRNSVNVRQDSDVDVGVLCNDSFIPCYPAGTTGETFDNIPADYQYWQFKNEVEEALVAYFGQKAVRRGNKAIDVRENSYHVDADVVPFFEYRYYSRDKSYLCGVALLPDKGGQVFNYPERLLNGWPQIPQHYENGASKNRRTNRSYKGVVRILKKVRHEMDEAGINSAKKIPGFLIECMVWNVPDEYFSQSMWTGKIEIVLRYLWASVRNEASCNDWCEVNDIKFLFRSTQPWTQQEAYTFICDTCNYIGVQVK